MLFKNPHNVGIQTAQLSMNFLDAATAKIQSTIFSFRSQSEAIYFYKSVEYNSVLWEEDCFISLRLSFDRPVMRKKVPKAFEKI